MTFTYPADSNKCLLKLWSTYP
ncbi:hypothetical protein NC652_007665 [Populus alba x Populus x berolinensis]|uniref:Uncharacterized protein n=1 Tax=Populus alba x Populus x berolinensis TaxID=444605 RepID=A0AAD6RHC6_9ROSI|nr:hypothetical protein NC652_007665 [Populus alba x Populus x berolinensis]KAJ7009029.1 hypothetical protein NC653_007622 [Populus alba x Populus x berolinensis]